MCVDDYEFRHHSARREKLCRRFTFRNEQDSERVFLVNISQFQKNGELCLCDILLHLSKKGLQVKDMDFYMPQFDITIQAGNGCKVPFNVMTQKQVIFIMRHSSNQQNYSYVYENEGEYGHGMQNQNQQCEACVKFKINSEVLQSMNQQEDLHFESACDNVCEIQSFKPKQNLIVQKQIETQAKTKNSRKPKQTQKTIQQVLTVTKAWRLMHQNYNHTLKTASKFLNLPKKTLDDYYLVLRVAQIHGYNFVAHLQQKIGHLRAFIRSQSEKISGRLPKQLKSFDIVPNPDIQKIIYEANNSKLQDNTIQNEQINHQQNQMKAE